jgi:hypothetical protein
MIKADKKTWLGRVLSVILMAPFVMSLIMKLRPNAEAIQGMVHLGFPESLTLTLAILEGLCIVVYLIPQTSVLGAVLFTGYLGGAICTHLRVGDPVYIQVALGVLIWLGIYLREPRLRQIFPFRCKSPALG